MVIQRRRDVRQTLGRVEHELRALHVAIAKRQLGGQPLELNPFLFAALISTADAIATKIRRQRYDSFTQPEGTYGGQH